MVHFGHLGNGTTVYDIERMRGGDYLTVAHISMEGLVKMYAYVTKEDLSRIIEQAKRISESFEIDFCHLSHKARMNYVWHNDFFFYHVNFNSYWHGTPQRQLRLLKDYIIAHDGYMEV